MVQVNFAQSQVGYRPQQVQAETNATGQAVGQGVAQFGETVARIGAKQMAMERSRNLSIYQTKLAVEAQAREQERIKDPYSGVGDVQFKGDVTDYDEYSRELASELGIDIKDPEVFAIAEKAKMRLEGSMFSLHTSQQAALATRATDEQMTADGNSTRHDPGYYDEAIENAERLADTYGLSEDVRDKFMQEAQSRYTRMRALGEMDHGGAMAAASILDDMGNTQAYDTLSDQDRAAVERHAKAVIRDDEVRVNVIKNNIRDQVNVAFDAVVRGDRIADEDIADLEQLSTEYEVGDVSDKLSLIKETNGALDSIVENGVASFSSDTISIAESIEGAVREDGTVDLDRYGSVKDARKIIEQRKRIADAAYEKYKEDSRGWLETNSPVVAMAVDKLRAQELSIDDYYAILQGEANRIFLDSREGVDMPLTGLLSDDQMSAVDEVLTSEAMRATDATGQLWSHLPADPSLRNSVVMQIADKHTDPFVISALMADTPDVSNELLQGRAEYSASKADIPSINSVGNDAVRMAVEAEFDKVIASFPTTATAFATKMPRRQREAVLKTAMARGMDAEAAGEYAVNMVAKMYPNRIFAGTWSVESGMMNEDDAGVITSILDNRDSTASLLGQDKWRSLMDSYRRHGGYTGDGATFSFSLRNTDNKNRYAIVAGDDPFQTPLEYIEVDQMSDWLMELDARLTTEQAVREASPLSLPGSGPDKERVRWWEGENGERGSDDTLRVKELNLFDDTKVRL